MADYREQRAPEILFNPAPLHQILKAGGEGPLPVPPAGGDRPYHAGRRYADVYCFHARKMRGGAQYKDPAMFLSAVGKPGSPCPTLFTADSQIVSVHYPDAPDRDHIRRLTPAEFEVLMGLPVGWTAFGHDGRPVSESARYKALGNSIVTGCAEYIMARIAKALREQEED